MAGFDFEHNDKCTWSEAAMLSFDTMNINMDYSSHYGGCCNKYASSD